MIFFLLFRAVEISYPGTSYNPTLRNHRALLDPVKEYELEFVKQEEHLKRVTTAMFQRIPAVECDIERMRH